MPKETFSTFVTFESHGGIPNIAKPLNFTARLRRYSKDNEPIFEFENGTTRQLPLSNWIYEISPDGLLILLQAGQEST